MAKRRRREVSDEEEEEEEVRYRRRAASQFFELEAVDTDDEEEDDEEQGEDDFIDDAEVVDSDSNENEDFAFRKRQVIHPQIGEEDEEEDIDEFERRIEERYGRKSRYKDEEDETEVVQQALLPTIKDSKLWMVKCAVGYEKEVAICLMQKQIDKAFNLKIKSVIALDHLQNYIYVEADKESHVREACKGMRHILLKNKIVLVPNSEMSNLLCVKGRDREFTKDCLVRLKTGNYKGDIAQIVDVDDIQRRVTVKLIPRIDYQDLVNKYEGNYKPKEVSSKICPQPRFWSASKAKALGISVKRSRDRITGDYFDIVDGKKFKDGFLYKLVSFKSISNKIQPTVDDLEKFHAAKERVDDEDINAEILSFSAMLAKNIKKNSFTAGDKVVVVNGDLIHIKGLVLKVEDDIVYFRPTNGDLPQNCLEIKSKDLTKLLEDNVSQVAYCEESVSLVSKTYNNKSRNRDETSGSIANFRPPPPKKGHGFGRARRDPLVNARIKIRQGPYHGMVGTIVEVRGSKVRVELEAQMNSVYVNRNQICENVNVEVNNSGSGLGGETPMYCATTPMHPLLTPTRDSAATPIHEGMRTPMPSRAWNGY
ncbi:putative transcription elongation factor SPT5 homolog 1 [Nicotiana sylvestris]|uniref:Transcription elongation factor SPT5 n=1 Tax=Nicotiana sylvestris TaxID=4096 RepID=A0A1U7WS33_NICSY|nr:PREDICTED: putative transcription elongation factor SPT5 homolog 1 [Nicotiana sylvestris]